MGGVDMTNPSGQRELFDPDDMAHAGKAVDGRPVRSRVLNVSLTELPPASLNLIIDQPRTGPEYRLSGRWVDGDVVKVWSRVFPNRAALMEWRAGRWSTVSRGRPV
jgi:hypothetical protein